VESILVVGAGLAGLSAARAARAAGFLGRLTLVGSERHPPYARPPLSKGYLSGALPRPELALETEGEDLAAEWVLGAEAAALDVRTHTLTLADGRRLSADGIVLATGSAAMVPPDLDLVEGVRPSNLTTLRTVEDADRLRDHLRPGTRLVIVGAGLIGTEVAATARAAGCEVVLLAREEVPLDRLYGDELAVHVAAVHSRHAVEIVCAAYITSVQLNGQRIASLTLDGGRVVPADVVLVAIGAAPGIGWLRGSGLELGDGVMCDRAGRTSHPGIVAVGDCAAWFDVHLERPHRTQHWTDALERPPGAIAALLGTEPPRAKPYLPYFWSDQYDLRIQMAGYASLADSVAVEQGDPTVGPFLAVYRRGGDPVAVLGVSSPREFTRWRRTIATAMAEQSVPTRASAMAAPAVAGPSPS